MAEAFITVCHRRVLNVARGLQQNEATSERLDTAYDQLTAILRNIRRVSRETLDATEMAEIVEDILKAIEDQKRQLEPAFEFGRPRQIRTRGRPLYYISREQLSHLAEAGFTMTQMAQILHVSKSVLKRRLRLYSINLSARYSSLSNEELDRKVQELVAGNRNLGQRMVQAMLLTDGHRVQRQRVADSLIRVDEAGVAMRWAQAIHRRYHGASHQDTNCLTV